jgi:transcriptional regulator with XRE-family HTH domain
LGLSQKHLAGAVGVRFQQIQKYECAANRLSAVRLWQLSKALDVPLSYFFEGFQGIDEEAPAQAPATTGVD